MGVRQRAAAALRRRAALRRPHARAASAAAAQWSRCSAEGFAPLRAALDRGGSPLALGLWPDARGRSLFATRDIPVGTLLLREPSYCATNECPTHTPAGQRLSALATDSTGADDIVIDGLALTLGDRFELVEDSLLVALCLFRGAYEAADPPPNAPPLPAPPNTGSNEDDVVLLGPLQLLEHGPLPSALPFEVRFQL